MSPRLTIRAIDLFERPLTYTHPFRFGAATIERASEAFVRVEIAVDGHGVATGAAAELMVPKWFDKTAEKSPEDTVDDLRRSLLAAADAYLSRGDADTAFGHHATHLGPHVAACARRGIPALAAAFGPAEIDKAICDALFRACGVGAFEGLAQNLAGLDARLTPDLDDAAVTGFLASRTPASRIAVRHTVGMADALDGPDGLASLLAQSGCRYVKLKLAGDVAEDCARLATIAAVLDGIPLDGVTLDGNEQYGDPEALQTLAWHLANDPALQPLFRRLLYLEQPLDRRTTFAAPLHCELPVIIDEADEWLDAFPRARDLGYRGVSAKSCKGLWKALLNGVRVAGSPGCFMAAEDLTCQPGLALQQDMTLAAFLGIVHGERNGHRYVDGFAEPVDGAAFAAAYPELYGSGADGRVRLILRDGFLPASVLGTGPGFGTTLHPDWSRLRSLALPA